MLPGRIPLPPTPAWKDPEPPIPERPSLAQSNAEHRNAERPGSVQPVSERSDATRMDSGPPAPERPDFVRLNVEHRNAVRPGFVRLVSERSDATRMDSGPPTPGRPDPTWSGAVRRGAAHLGTERLDSSRSGLVRPDPDWSDAGRAGGAVRSGDSAGSGAGRGALAVPETVISRFLVVAAGRGGLPDLGGLLGAGTLADTARRLLRAGRITVSGHDVPTPWSSRLPTIGCLPDDTVDAVLDARRHVLVSGAAVPAEQPRHAQAVRLVARVLAAELEGRVVDLESHRLLSPGEGVADEPERFRLDAEWFGVFLTGAGPGRARADTYGLHRFGAPELVLRDVLYGDLPAAVDLLGDAARWLYAEFAAEAARGARTVPVPQGLTVTGAGCPGCGTALVLPRRNGDGAP
ncbi:hypothetical protein ACFQU9_21960 [Actinomadura namibiensis]|uniref:Uncharacterized protein n=1 Tax=Actinomadura namibiensis TaxID=182080 RepID=A0A7W3LQJ5_ACTNM|nr:hypothetical protein [Actinomadura namibiensis]MBA8952412.1 hypothetical protein [Actinomadura namibiensis]